MVTIDKSNLASGIFEVLYDIVSENVPDTQDPARSKWWFSSYPDKKVFSTSDYPIGIIEPVTYAWSDFKIQTKWINYRASIVIFSTSAKEADNLIDKVAEVLELERGNKLRDANIYSYTVTAVDNTTFKHGSLIIHIRSIDLEFKIPMRGSY